MFYRAAITVVLAGSAMLCAYSFFPLLSVSPFLLVHEPVDISILLFNFVMAILAALSSAMGAIMAFRLLKKEEGMILGSLLVFILSISLVSLSRVYFL